MSTDQAELDWCKRSRDHWQKNKIKIRTGDWPFDRYRYRRCAEGCGRLAPVFCSATWRDRWGRVEYTGHFCDEHAPRHGTVPPIAKMRLICGFGNPPELPAGRP
jgi:hypothetical protein